MGLVELSIQDHIARVTLNDGENRFNPTFLDAFLETLDTVESTTDATTLVVHSAHEKIFSNGIDLDWLLPVLQAQDRAVSKGFFYQLNHVFKRLVTYPLVTVAAISGHAFAGGAILCCAFDFRLMRSDRGYFCLPEVDLGIPFLPGMNALLRSAIPADLLREMELTGLRLTARQCQESHIVRQACHMDELLTEAMAFARQVNKKRPVVAELKARLNASIVQALDVADVSYIESGQFNIV
jgi:enoyl-CoA hydratase/carnithine racemase